MKYFLTDTSLVVKDTRMNSLFDILDSEIFSNILTRFIKLYKEQNSNEDILTLTNIIEAYRKVLSRDHDILKNSLITQFTDLFIHFNESFYDYWRSLSRYCLLTDERNIVETSERLYNLFINFYREIQQNLMNRKFYVYRQLPAGFNSILSVTNVSLKLDGAYKKLSKIPYITQNIIKPPLF